MSDKQVRVIKWDEWMAGREKRRALSRKVAPEGTRRLESPSDKRLRAAFHGERGPDLLNNSNTPDAAE